MADSRDKGKRGEYQIRDLLTEHTGLDWARVPGSGGFGANHALKGDVYLPSTTGHIAAFAIEVKWYKDEHFNSTIFKESNSQLDKWLEQAAREADQMSAKPMLVFKKDRGSWLACVALDGNEDLADEPCTVVYTNHESDQWVIIPFDKLLALKNTEYFIK